METKGRALTISVRLKPATMQLLKSKAAEQRDAPATLARKLIEEGLEEEE